MEASMVGTRAKLLSLIEDIEIVFKELLEYVSAGGGVGAGGGVKRGGEDIDPGQLIALLQLKDSEYQQTLALAREQGERQKELEAVREEVQRRDTDIKQLQRSLKEAESVLATAIYQAKQKLAAINQANKRKVSSEELIKYAHKISASNAVAAPPTWVPGDTRRPYPTELDMRCGVLGRLGDLGGLGGGTLLSGGGALPPAGFSDPPTPSRAQPQQPGGAGFGGASLTWQPSAEVQSTLISGSTASSLSLGAPVSDRGPHGGAGGRPDPDSVELMTSDSSSSSSSDE